jgi:hypothetical protein
VPFAYAAGISAAGGIASGLIGAGASNKAASEQAAAQQQALALQGQVFNQTQQNIQPYVGAGQNALMQLQNLLGLGPGGNPAAANPILAMLGIGPDGATGGGINPATFQGSPGYQYQVQQGQNAITNAASRTGAGGNALMALQANGQQLANQNWNQYLSNAGNAWQQLLGNVGGVASSGLNASSILGGAGQNFANAAGANIAGAGNARSAGTIGSASALGGGLTGGLQSFNSLLTNPNSQALVNSWINGGNTAGIDQGAWDLTGGA